MLAKLAALAALLPTLNAQASYSNSTSWTSLPGSLNVPWGSCANANWPQSTVGQALVPQKPDAELQEMLNEISIDRKNCSYRPKPSPRLPIG